MVDQFRTFETAPNAAASVVRIKNWNFTIKEIVIGTLALCFIVICIVFLALYLSETVGDVQSPKSSSLVGDEFCLSKECMTTASRALEMMNTSVDPCDNFFNYACGNYQAEYPTHFGGSVVGDITQRNKDRIKEILDKSDPRSTNWSFQRKLTQFYNACKDRFQRERVLGKPFLEQIVAKLGGWDLLGTWNKTAWDFRTVLRTVQSDFRVSAFFSTGVYFPMDGKPRIRVRMPTKLWYLDTALPFVRKRQKKYMKRVASLLMRDAKLVNVTKEEHDSRIDQFVQDVFEVGHKLKSHSRDGERPYKTDIKTTVGQMNKGKTKFFDWKDQLSYIFRPATINDDTELEVMFVGYLKKIPEVIESLPDADRDRMLHNYIIWTCVENYTSALSWEYLKLVRGVKGGYMTTGRQCMDHIEYYMNDALSAVFVQRHLHFKGRQKVEDIIEHLRKVLRDRLDSTTWMDDKTKELAKSKLAKTSFKMGYPEWLANRSKVDEVYADLKVNNEDFFGSLLSANQFLRTRQVEDYVNHDVNEEWPLGVYDARVSHLRFKNEILITAGLLQHPLYDPDDPYFKTFGSLGAGLAEFLHGVVDIWGGKYDINGTYTRNMTWWSPQTVAAYKDKIHKCVVEVYLKQSQMDSVFGISPIGVVTDTSDEIAFISGIRLALKAYQDWVNAFGINEKKLWGLDLSAEQMIFLSYAQSRCEKRSNTRFLSGVNRRFSLEFDINMAFGQLQEFSDAFQCKAKNIMNQEKKCTYF